MDMTPLEFYQSDRDIYAFFLSPRNGTPRQMETNAQASQGAPTEPAVPAAPPKPPFACTTFLEQDAAPQDVVQYVSPPASPVVDYTTPENWQGCSVSAALQACGIQLGQRTQPEKGQADDVCNSDTDVCNSDTDVHLRAVNARILGAPHNVLHYLAFMVAVVPRWEDMRPHMEADMHAQCGAFLRANIQGPHAAICARVRELYAQGEGGACRAVSDNDVLITVQRHWTTDFASVAIVHSSEELRLFSAVVAHAITHARLLVPAAGLPADYVLLAKTFYFLDHCNGLQPMLRRDCKKLARVPDEELGGLPMRSPHSQPSLRATTRSSAPDMRALRLWGPRVGSAAPAVRGRSSTARFPSMAPPCLPETTNEQ